MNVTQRRFLVLPALIATLACAIAEPPQKAEPKNEPKSLFDGKTLTGWKVTDFAGKGDVSVKDSQLILGDGFVTGVNYTNPVPKINYEVSLNAMRVDGSDFFCGLTCPYKDAHITLVIGGWGGGVCGISSIDDFDASENETVSYHAFKQGQWYHVRLRVAEDKIEAWLDKKKIVDFETEGRRLGLRPGIIELSAPFGLASYATTAALKDITLKTFESED